MKLWNDAATMRSAARWLVAAAIALAMLLALYRVRTFDTFFHLATGRYILETGVVPTTDPFSFTFRGAPWLNHSWGFQALLAALHGALGFAGLSVWQALLAGVLALVPCLGLRALPRLWPWAALLSVLPHAAFREVLEARPHVPAFVCLALTLHLCLHRRTLRSLAWLVPIYAAWTTLHGSHVLLLGVCAVCGLAAALERRFAEVRALAVVLGATVALGSWIAPDAFFQSGEHVASSFLESNVHEWSPVSATDLISFWPGRAFAAMVLLAFVGLVSRHDDAEELTTLPRGVAPWVLLLAFSVLALTSRRMLALYGLGVSPLWLPYAARALDRIVLAAAPTRRHAVPPALAALGLLVLGGSAFASGPEFVLGAGLMTERLPSAAVATLRANSDVRRVYNAYNFGGYLMFVGYPRDGVFVDGRAITVYPPAFLDEFERAYDDARVFEGLAARFVVDAVLMPSASPRTRHLLAYLSASPRWQRVHHDDVASAYVRRAPR